MSKDELKERRENLKKKYSTEMNMFSKEAGPNNDEKEAMINEMIQESSDPKLEDSEQAKSEPQSVATKSKTEATTKLEMPVVTEENVSESENTSLS